jgi:hypothetical protein
MFFHSLQAACSIHVSIPMRRNHTSKQLQLPECVYVAVDGAAADTVAKYSCIVHSTQRTFCAFFVLPPPDASSSKLLAAALSFS